MKYVSTVLGLVFVFSFAIECEAQRPDRGGNKGKAQQGQRKQFPQGQRQGAGDPSEMATKMMSEFDKNGDNKLDSTELTALFTKMREGRNRTEQGTQQGRRGEGRNGSGEGQRGERAEGKRGQRGERPSSEEQMETEDGNADGKTGERKSRREGKGEGRKGGKKRKETSDEDKGGVEPTRPGGA